MFVFYSSVISFSEFFDSSTCFLNMRLFVCFLIFFVKMMLQGEVCKRFSFFLYESFSFRSKKTILNLTNMYEIMSNFSYEVKNNSKRAVDKDLFMCAYVFVQIFCISVQCSHFLCWNEREREKTGKMK